MTGDGTRAVRAGLPEPEAFEPALPGPVFAAHYHLPGDAAGPYTYGRDTNPTWTHLERAIGELESPDGTAHTVAFASGMAAISAVLFSQLRSGDAVVLPSDGYQLLPAVRTRLESYGIEVRTAPTAHDAQLDVLDGARLLWIETPSNPGLDVCDVRRLADEAHRRGALVAVDNTLATPLGQRPLDLEADFSVASGTKALTGHGDVLLGYVSTRDAALADAVRQWRKTVGAIPGPMESWLAHRSLATLALRVRQQSAGALALAAALADRPEVTGLRHPGLPAGPGPPARRPPDASRTFRLRGVLHPPGQGPRGTLPGRPHPGRRRHELRRRALHRRTPRPLGRRRRPRGLHPLLGRHRGPGRSDRGRPPRLGHGPRELTWRWRWGWQREPERPVPERAVPEQPVPGRHMKGPAGYPPSSPCRPRLRGARRHVFHVKPNVPRETNRSNKAS
ncbi:hypothetical protein HEK616_69170 [Streptomyces nigrescens]|uniref:Cystathionine gamma-lyase n=1 Tax=Streptomyces nigrescens TaxID=1920 RepID=A0ABM8A440_STRNI|nr:hypothetical protein HEK616_69170 [Streptomyces nigrescens]